MIQLKKILFLKFAFIKKHLKPIVGGLNNFEMLNPKASKLKIFFFFFDVNVNTYTKYGRQKHFCNNNNLRLTNCLKQNCLPAVS